MANTNIGKPHRGAGRVYLGAYNAVAESRILKDTGNVAKYTLTPEMESNEVAYTGDGAGGTFYLDVRAKGVSVSIEFDEWRPELMAAANAASVKDVTAGAIVDEAHTAHLGALVRFAHIADTSVAPEVTNAAGTTTYVAGTDYTVEANGHGIVIVTGGTIVAAATIHVSYTKKAHQVLEGLVKAGAEYSLFFAGQNGIGGASESVDVFRVVLFGDGGQDLIMTKPGPLKLKGTVLVDPSVVVDPAAPLSRFYRIKSA